MLVAPHEMGIRARAMAFAMNWWQRRARYENQWQRDYTVKVSVPNGASMCLLMIFHVQESEDSGK